MAVLAILLASCGWSLKPLPPVDTVVQKAAAGDDAALALLVQYFASPLEEESLKAFNALVEAKGRSVLILLEALENKDMKVAEPAAGALGNLRDKRAVQPLIKALERPGFPRYVAVWALGEIGDEAAIPVLARSLGDANPGVRKYAVKALVKFGGKAMPTVLRLLDDPNPLPRHYALRVLGQLGDRQAVGPIMEHYRNQEPEVALWALGKLGAREAFPVIAGETRNADWKIRLAAVQALGALQDGRATPILGARLDDPEWVVREWAARALEDLTQGHQLYRDQYGKLVVPYNIYR